MNRMCKRCILVITLIQFVFLSAMAPLAEAELVSTRALIENSQQAETLDEVSALMAREDVRQELERLGVDPLVVQDRMASLTPEEISMLQSKMADLPAGAGALEVIGVVFLVLLLLELVGVTNVFSRF